MPGLVTARCWAGLGWGGDGTWEKATKTHYHPLSTVHSMLYAVYTGAKHCTTYNKRDHTSESPLLPPSMVSWTRAPELDGLTTDRALVSSPETALAPHCPLNESSAMPFIAEFSQGSADGQSRGDFQRKQLFPSCCAAAARRGANR